MAFLELGGLYLCTVVAYLLACLISRNKYLRVFLTIVSLVGIFAVYAMFSANDVADHGYCDFDCQNPMFKNAHSRSQQPL